MLENQTYLFLLSLSQPLSSTQCTGRPEDRQLPSQQDKGQHDPHSQHLQDHHHRHHQQQHLGGTTAVVLSQMRSLKEKEAVVDEHLEDMVQRRRALEQLEKVRGTPEC